MLTARLTHDTLTPHLRQLITTLAPGGALSKALGRAAANELKKHFRARNKTPNALGGARTNFWSRVAESVASPQALPGRITIQITHPAIAQKVHGGTITPKKAKNLAIPIHPRAHGKSPRIFADLTFAATGKGTKLLGLREAGGFTPLYVLKKSVTQAPDPKALPRPADITAALTTAARIVLR